MDHVLLYEVNAVLSFMFVYKSSAENNMNVPVIGKVIDQASADDIKRFTGNVSRSSQQFLSKQMSKLPYYEPLLHH